MNLIQSGDFVRVATDKYIDKGLKRGHTLYVASIKALPESIEDPYLQRVFILTHKVTKDGHTLPNEGLALMDPREVSKVGVGRQKRYTEILRADFAPDEEEPVDAATP